MTRQSFPLGVRGIPILVAALLLAVLAGPAAARGGKDDRGEVRVAGACSAGATSKLKLKSRDRGIELEFELDHNRIGATWRVAIVHERRVAWRGTARTLAPSGSFEIDRRLVDLRGSDTVTVRAWGPAGLTCRATTSLPDAT